MFTIQTRLLSRTKIFLGKFGQSIKDELRRFTITNAENLIKKIDYESNRVLVSFMLLNVSSTVAVVTGPKIAARFGNATVISA